jgi:hypothetical protein
MGGFLCHTRELDGEHATWNGGGRVAIYLLIPLSHDPQLYLLGFWVALVVCCVVYFLLSSSSLHRMPLYKAHLSSPRLLWSNHTFCLMTIRIALMCCLRDHLGDSLGLLSLVMSPPTTWM